MTSFSAKDLSELIEKVAKTTEVVIKKSGVAYSKEFGKDLYSTDFNGYAPGTILEARYLVEDDGESESIKVVHVKIKNSDFKPTDDIRVWGKTVVSDKLAASFKSAKLIAEKFGYSGLRLCGDSGSGKSTVVSAFCEEFGFNYFMQDCSTLKEPSSLFGDVGVRDNSTYFQPSPFSQLIQKDNTVIFLDEINRVKPNILNPLMQLLSIGYTRYKDNEIRRGNNLIAIAAMNEGSEFTGTYHLDAAFQRRFPITAKIEDLTVSQEIKAITLQVPDFDIKKANLIASLALELRNRFVDGTVELKFTTAYSVEVARLLSTSDNITIATAFDMIFINKLREPKDAIDLIKNKSRTIGEINYNF